MLYWTAYSDLQDERPAARYVDKKPVIQRIPWTAIARYADHHGLNVDELKLFVWAMDKEIIAGHVPETETEDEGQTSD